MEPNYNDRYHPGPLPRRTTGWHQSHRNADAETEVTDTGTNPDYDNAAESFRQQWEAETARLAQHAEERKEARWIPTGIRNDSSTPEFVIHEQDTPPWNAFDTVMRRAVMLGLAIVLWVGIAATVALIVGGTWLFDQLGEWAADNGTTTQAPAFPGEAEPGYVCDPLIEEC